MAYISKDNIWKSEFYKNVSAKDETKDVYFNQLTFQVNDV